MKTYHRSYLNDLENYLASYECKGVSTTINKQDHPIDIAFRILCLLYADHTALLSATAADLQYTLNIFDQYCNKYKLKINSNKTKIVIFNGTSRDYKRTFMIGNNILENVKEYKYLGITFTKSNSFRYTKTILCQQATKAFYYVLTKSRDNHVSTECKRKSSCLDYFKLPRSINHD